MTVNIQLLPNQVVVSGKGFSYTLPLPETATDTSNNVVLEDGSDFDSNSIEVLTYEPLTRTLGVKFQNNDTLYRYKDVPLQKVFSMTRAYSLNQYWRDDIKPHHESLDKVEYASYVSSWDGIY